MLLSAHARRPQHDRLTKVSNLLTTDFRHDHKYSNVLTTGFCHDHKYCHTPSFTHRMQRTSPLAWTQLAVLNGCAHPQCSCCLSCSKGSRHQDCKASVRTSTYCLATRQFHSQPIKRHHHVAAMHKHRHLVMLWFTWAMLARVLGTTSTEITLTVCDVLHLTPAQPSNSHHCDCARGRSSEFHI